MIDRFRGIRRLSGVGMGMLLLLGCLLALGGRTDSPSRAAAKWSGHPINFTIPLTA